MWLRRAIRLAFPEVGDHGLAHGVAHAHRPGGCVLPLRFPRFSTEFNGLFGKTSISCALSTT
jgi:hypothetical protein